MTGRPGLHRLSRKGDRCMGDEQASTLAAEERQALRRLRQGDIRGLETLVRRYQVQAVRAAYLISQDRQLAEDVVQEAFLRVFERIDQFDLSRPFGPWFFRLVVNDTLKAVARRSREQSMDDGPEGLSLADLLADPQPGPEEAVERSDLHDQVWEALERLSPAQRAVVVQRYYLGLPEREIAWRQNRAPGTVKRHLHDARRRLRRWLSALVETGG